MTISEYEFFGVGTSENLPPAEIGVEPTSRKAGQVEAQSSGGVRSEKEIPNEGISRSQGSQGLSLSDLPTLSPSDGQTIPQKTQG